MTIVVQGPTVTRTLSGDYKQSGSLGGSSGNFSCTDGTTGPMALVGMQMSGVGFSAEFAVNAQQCNLPGDISGILLSRP